MSLEPIPGTMNFTLQNGLCIFRGSMWEVPVTICSVENNEMIPTNIEGFTGRCTIKDDAESTVVIAEPTVTIVDPLQGYFTISLTDKETDAIDTTGETYREVNRYQYDVYFDDANSNSYRVLQGYVEVSPSISPEV